MKKKKHKSKLREKLFNKYRLVILNDDSFEERMSFKLTRLNVFIITGVVAIVLIVFTAVLIAYTPIKEYIPGYSSTALKKKATLMVYKVDSLEQVLEVNNVYIKNIKQVLTGKMNTVPINKDSIMKQFQIDKDTLNLEPSRTDSLFRQNVEQADRYSLFEKAIKKATIVFFAPVIGKITQKYDPNIKHFAVDVVAKKGTPVKAVADGTVIFAEWTAKTGYVIILQHAEGFISVYKHNSQLLKQQGDLVKSGEVISTVGSTGELSTGPHLHFELWDDGYPVNPTKYINFE